MKEEKKYVKKNKKKKISLETLCTRNFVLTPPINSDSTNALAATKQPPWSRRKKNKAPPPIIKPTRVVVVNWRPPSRTSTLSRSDKENNNDANYRRSKSRRRQDSKTSSQREEEGNKLHGQLVEFATLPPESFLGDLTDCQHNNRHHRNENPDFHTRLTLHLRRHNNKSTSKTFNVRISFTHHGLTLSKHDAKKLYFANDIRNENQHMEEGSIRLEWPSRKGIQYRLASDSISLHDSYTEDQTTVLGVKGGLPEHALICCQGNVMPVFNEEFEEKVVPFLFKEPFWRTVNDRPYLRAPVCAYCGVEATSTNTPEERRRIRRDRQRPRARRGFWGRKKNKQNEDEENEIDPLLPVVTLSACTRCVEQKSATVHMYCSRRCQKSDWKEGHKELHTQIEENKPRKKAAAMLSQGSGWNAAYAGMVALWLLMAYLVPLVGTFGWIGLAWYTLVNIGLIPRFQISVLEDEH